MLVVGIAGFWPVFFVLGFDYLRVDVEIEVSEAYINSICLVN